MCPRGTAGRVSWIKDVLQKLYKRSMDAKMKALGHISDALMLDPGSICCFISWKTLNDRHVLFPRDAVRGLKGCSPAEKVLDRSKAIIPAMSPCILPE